MIIRDHSTLYEGVINWEQFHRPDSLRERAHQQLSFRKSKCQWLFESTKLFELMTLAPLLHHRQT